MPTALTPWAAGLAGGWESVASWASTTLLMIQPSFIGVLHPRPGGRVLVEVVGDRPRQPRARRRAYAGCSPAAATGQRAAREAQSSVATVRRTSDMNL